MDVSCREQPCFHRLRHGLDYENPHLSPFGEMQRFKLHPDIRKYLEAASRISYGARAISEGAAIPAETLFPRRLLAATRRIPERAENKGQPHGMKSGMIAAEALVELFQAGDPTARNASTTARNSRQAGCAKNAGRPQHPPLVPFRHVPRVDLFRAGNICVQSKMPWDVQNHSDHDRLKKPPSRKRSTIRNRTGADVRPFILCLYLKHQP